MFYEEKVFDSVLILFLIFKAAEKLGKFSVSLRKRKKKNQPGFKLLILKSCLNTLLGIRFCHL